MLYSVRYSNSHLHGLHGDLIVKALQLYFRIWSLFFSLIIILISNCPIGLYQANCGALRSPTGVSYRCSVPCKTLLNEQSFLHKRKIVIWIFCFSSLICFFFPLFHFSLALDLFCFLFTWLSHFSSNHETSLASSHLIFFSVWC